jgi:hypothetical protein
MIEETSEEAARVEPSPLEPSAKKERRVPVAHPILFAVFPVLSLFSANIVEVTWGQVFPPLGISIAGTILVLLLAWAILRNLQRAGIVTSVIVLLFFSYGSVSDFLEDHKLFGVSLGSARVIFPLWGVITAAAGVFAWRIRRTRNTTKILNVVAVALVLTTLVPIISHQLGERHSSGPSAAKGASPSKAGAAIDKRDIYYIMVEDYGGPRTLKEVWNFDDTPFLNQLRALGLYVADDALANYPNTTLSVSSSLNLDYLNDLLTKPTGGVSSSWLRADGLFKGPRAARYLKGQGYKYVHIGGWWEPSRKDPYADVNFVFDPLSEFSRTLLEGTAAWPIARQLGIGKTALDNRAAQFARVPYQLTKTIGARTMFNQPTFVFTHLLIPHPPYVFDRTGTFVTKAQEKAKGVKASYLDQIVYTNKVIINLLKKLLSGPESTRPIVILQSDEGPQPSWIGPQAKHFTWRKATSLQLRSKFPILSAYYLPGVSKTELYPSISPVNSLRVVFNDYLGANFPILPDRSYIFPDFSHLYTFVDVTAKVDH